MSGASWWALLTAWVAALALPGPDIFLLLRLAARSRSDAVLAALGVMTGNLVWILATVLGITTLLAAFPVLLPAMQLVGVAVLVVLGVQSMRSGVAQLRAGTDFAFVAKRGHPWLLGAITNLSNPKALIFFTALLTQFLPPDADTTTRALIVVILVSTGVAWFVLVALASSAKRFRSWFDRAAPWIDIVAGALFLLVACGIAIEVALTLLADAPAAKPTTLP